jgi:hypothetical protein
MWVVDQPAVQSQQVRGPLLARVEIRGGTSLLQSLPDPRIARSTASDERGHHFGVADTGTLVVSVPFSEAHDLEDVRILLTDVSEMSTRTTNLDELAAVFDQAARDVSPVRSLSTPDLRASPDWQEVAASLGLAAD